MRRQITRHVCFQQPRTGLNHAFSSGGVDSAYGASGWFSSDKPFLYGTPDVNKDGVPDIWSVRTDGSVRFHAGGRTAVSDTGTEVVGANDYWQKRITIG